MWICARQHGPAPRNQHCHSQKPVLLLSWCSCFAECGSKSTCSASPPCLLSLSNNHMTRFHCWKWHCRVQIAFEFSTKSLQPTNAKKIHWKNEAICPTVSTRTIERNSSIRLAVVLVICQTRVHWIKGNVNNFSGRPRMWHGARKESFSPRQEKEHENELKHGDRPKQLPVAKQLQMHHPFTNSTL